MPLNAYRVCSKLPALLLLCVYGYAGSTGANGIVWPRSVQDIPAANKTPLPAIEALVNTAAANEGLPQLRVGKFRFAAFGKNTIDLIATVDSSGRNLFYGLVGVCRTDNGYRHFMLESAPPHLLAAEIIDLDGTGVSQLIVKRLVGQYHGASTAPIFWYSIYKVEGCVPKDVSTEFPQFYRKEVLPRFAFVERALSEKSAKARKRYEVQAAFVELKYQRLILKRPRAGIPQALSWAASPDPDIQMLAIDILKNANAPAALEALRHLAGASNYEVSQAAKNALAAQKKEKPTSTH